MDEKMYRHVTIRIESGDCAEYKYRNVFVKNDEKYLTLMDENKQIVFKCRMDDIEFFEKSIN